MAEQRNDRKVVFPSEESAKDIPASSSAELNELQSSAECNVEERRGESSQQLVEWDDPMAVEMEQLLIPLIKEASRTAIKKITECGCSEEEAEWAVLTSGVYQGYMDLTNNIVNGAFALLEYTNGFDTSIRPLFDDLESLAGYILLEMVSVMKETKPFLSVGEAMWLLLLFELNILHAVVAATPNPNPNPNPTGADPQPSQLSHVSGSGKKGKRLSKTKIATPVVKTPGNMTNIPASSSGVAVSEKDGMIASLMQRKQQLQKEVQGWIDWTNVKVGQATRKLSMDQAELRMLRKEIQFEENIIKRRCELQDALSHLGAQIDAINSAHFESREEELQKQRRTLEVEMSSLQGELAALKGNSADLQANIDKARKGQSKFEGLWQQEEREKTKLLEKAESIRRERQERKQKTKIEEEKLITKGEENSVKYEEQMNKLSAQISALKLGAVGESSSSGQGGLKREWECVMCLTEPNSVVFIPCAHQAKRIQLGGQLVYMKKHGTFGRHMPNLKAKSEQQRKNRMSEVTGPTTGCSRPARGSRSAIEHYHKLRNELQKESNLFECFEHMHKKKNGAFVDERSKRIVLYVDVVGGVKKQRIYDLGTKASSFISENSSSSSATSQFHQAAMKEMLNQQLESMQAEMEAKLQAERAQMQAQIASLMDELRCNGMLSTSMPRPPTTEA
nr:putative E3 ubiquitin-protein ligase RF298 [Ipomoea trifida]